MKEEESNQDKKKSLIPKPILAQLDGESLQNLNEISQRNVIKNSNIDNKQQKEQAQQIMRNFISDDQQGNDEFAIKDRIQKIFDDEYQDIFQGQNFENEENIADKIKQKIIMQKTKDIIKKVIKEKESILKSKIQNDENFMSKAKELINGFSSNKFNLDQMIQNNQVLQHIIKISEKNERFQGYKHIIFKMTQDIENGNFSWDLWEEDLDGINEYLSMFLGIQKEYSFLYFLDVSKIREMFPLTILIEFFKFPPFYVKLLTYDKINNFYCNTISLISTFYIDYSMHKRAQIKAENIQQLDPCIRILIREYNNIYFGTNFLSIDIFLFILNELIDKQLLTINPRLNLKNSTPFLQYLLEFVLKLYEYGLFKIHQSKKLISSLFQVSEIIENFEVKASSYTLEKYSETEINNIVLFLKKCRDIYCSICIHHIILSCDYSLQQYIITQNQNSFQNFIFKQPSSFTFLANITIKYLSSYKKIAGHTLQTSWQKDALQQIYYFIGDFSNDIFLNSMVLIKDDLFDFYQRILHNSGKIIEVLDIQNAFDQFFDVIKKVNSFLDAKKHLGTLFVKMEHFCAQLDYYQKIMLTKLNLNFQMMIVLYYNLEKSEKDIFLKGLVYFQKMIMNYLPAQSVIFQQQTSEYFHTIMIRKNLDTMMMMKDIFITDSNLINISPNIFLFNFMMYKFFLENLIQNINENNFNQNMKVNIAALLLFHSFFSDVLDDHKIKLKRRRKFNLMISHEISDYIKDYVYTEFIQEPEQTLNDLADLSFSIKNFNLENIAEYKKQIHKIEPKYFLQQFNFSILKIFNKACYHQFSGITYSLFKDSIKLQSNVIEIQNKKFLQIMYQRIKFFDRFYVFPQNHVITERQIHFMDEGNLLQEFVFTINHKFFYDNIYQQIEFAQKYLNLKELDKLEIRYIEKLLYKGIFPSIYKHAQACKMHLYHLTNKINSNLTKKIVEDIVKVLDTVQGETMEIKVESMKDSREYQFLRFVVDLFKLQDTYGVTSKAIKDFKNEFVQANCFYITDNIYQLIEIILNLHQKLIYQKNPIDKNYPENVQPKMLLNQRQSFLELSHDFQVIQMKNLMIDAINYLAHQIQDIYFESPFVYVIERYNGQDEKTYQNEWIKKRLTYSYSLQNLTKDPFGLIKQQSTSIQSLNYQKIFRPFKRIYKEIKQDSQKNVENNNFLQTVISKKEQGQNLKNLIWHFMGEIHEMNLNINSTDIVFENEFFYNEQFAFLIVNMDNLMSWRGQIKDQFYKEIKEPSSQIYDIDPKLVIQSLCSIQYMLWKLVLYKTFQDKVWDEYKGLFLVLSNFFDNLITNNRNFRELLSQESYIYGALKTEGNFLRSFDIFFETYMKMEVCASESPFWLDQKNEIGLEDQSHIFFLIKNNIESVTKHLNGLMLTNQKRIYTYRIDIWKGIINRIVDDLDSSFYDIKNAIISYYMALLEGFPDEIVSFMFSNLEIQQIYSQIISLVLKLLINQLKIYDEEDNSSRKKSNVIKIIAKKRRQNIVTDQEVADFKFDDEDLLLQIYKRKEKMFGDHKILKIVINLFILVKNMSFKIKFYELFLQEKNQKVKEYFSDKIDGKAIGFQKKKEILVHKFLTDIVEDIEVETEIIKKDAHECYLQKMFFRRPPESFFLNDIRKENFETTMDITSEVTKQRDLFAQVVPLNYVMQEQQKYYKTYGKLYFLTTEEFYKNLHYFLYLLSFIINIVLLISIKFENVEDQSVYPSAAIIEETTLQTFIYIIGITIIVFSCICSCMWLYFRRNIKTQQKLLETEQHKAIITTQDKIYIYIFRACLLEARFRAFYLHLIFSLLGLTVNYFFYTLNLLLVANLSLTLNYVMMAIVRHWGKFLITLMITIIVVLFYSFLMMTYFQDQVSGNFESDICEDYIACFLNSINFGLRLGGGISDPFYLQPDPEKYGYWGRFFIDITFFFIVKMVLLNLIAGIIIDTFSELRDELNEREKDAKTVCFICGLTKWQVEKKGQDFQTHIEDVHEKWQYLYFMSRMENEDKASFTGFEQLIYEKYQNDDTSWFPKKDFLDSHSYIKKIR